MQLLPALITVLSLIMYLIMAANVGKARARCGIAPPALTGNAEFERYYRVHVNTMEFLVAFLPALWIFSLVWSAPIIASALGSVWIIGRIIYAIGYYKDAKQRMPGFFITLFATVTLTVGALAGILKGLIVG